MHENMLPLFNVNTEDGALGCRGYEHATGARFYHVGRRCWHVAFGVYRMHAVGIPLLSPENAATE